MSEVVGKTFDAPILMRLLSFVKPYLNVFYATATFASEAISVEMEAMMKKNF